MKIEKYFITFNFRGCHLEFKPQMINDGFDFKKYFNDNIGSKIYNRVGVVLGIIFNSKVVDKHFCFFDRTEEFNNYGDVLKFYNTVMNICKDNKYALLNKESDNYTIKQIANLKLMDFEDNQIVEIDYRDFEDMYVKKDECCESAPIMMNSTKGIGIR